MLRKDVKIGLGIGGGVLAVIVVYLLITAGSTRPSEVTLAPDPAPQAGENTTSAAKSTDPGAQAAKPTPAPGGAEAAKPASSKQPAVDPWDKALNTGRLDSGSPPLLLTETPSTPTNAPAQTPQVPAGAAPQPAEASTAGAQPTAPAVTPPAIDRPTTAPSADRTHVIQPGENFSTIAQAVYGNSSYYPHLMRANPKIDPKKLRPGMTIVIPDPAQVVAIKSADAAQLASDARPTIDDGREYRVQMNDSLYKIALKLYGRADKVDAIYELNKDTIGPNRSYLKAGMILKLPEPPSAEASAAR